MLLGTPHYMSPEQTRSAKLVDARSDQYALGVMLYECVTGRKPFTGESSYALMSAILEAPIARPSSLVAGVPAALDDVILHAMARDPEERFPSVAAVTEAATASPVEASTASRHPADAAPLEEAATAAKRAPSRSIGESRAPARQGASARPPATPSSVPDAAAASPIGANGAPII